VLTIITGEPCYVSPVSRASALFLCSYQSTFHAEICSFFFLHSGLPLWVHLRTWSHFALISGKNDRTSQHAESTQLLTVRFALAGRSRARLTRRCTVSPWAVQVRMVDLGHSEHWAGLPRVRASRFGQDSPDRTIVGFVCECCTAAAAGAAPFSARQASGSRHQLYFAQFWRYAFLFFLIFFFFWKLLF